MTTTLEKVKYETTQSVYRGNIFLADIPKSSGSIQFGERPFLILSNNIGNKYSNIVWGVPLTSKDKKKKMPTHSLIESSTGLNEDSIAIGEQPISLSMDRLKHKICEINNDKIMEIELAHFISGAFNENWIITPRK